MQTGTVKYYSSEKRYGFIANDSGAEDSFVHATELENRVELLRGDRVEFDIEFDNTRGKDRAVRVRVL